MKARPTTMTPLDDLADDGESRAGAKAYNCARLRKAGFRVPDGLVLFPNATDEDVDSLGDHPWFNDFPDDALFAVRSSGIGEDGEGESFAGIHDTVLDVSREGIRDAVARCRQSAHSTHALEYRRAKGLPMEDIRMGVLIQRMIHPDAAGVAFTVNPLSGSRNELVINSSWGVAEALVSGQVDPDEFVVRKEDLSLLWSRAGQKDKTSPGIASLSLSPAQIRELAGLLLRIEQNYGAPQDVEWCHDASGFWIVQSRPVTTEHQSSSEIEWTRANLVEILPDLTSPQALASFEKILNQAERQYLGKLAAPDDVLGPMLRVFNGRAYFNLSQVRRICALGKTAPADMLRSMGHAEALRPEDEKPARPGIGESLATARDMMRILARHMNIARVMREHDARIRKDMHRFAPDPGQLPDAEIWSTIDSWLQTGPDTMQTVLLLSGVLIHELPLRKICDNVGFSFEQLVYPQLAVGERSVSAQQAFDLSELADIARREPTVVEWLSQGSADRGDMRRALKRTVFLAVFERFMKIYGHRGRYESDWSLPRYSEDPSALLHAIRAHLKSGPKPADNDSAREQESVEAWEAFAQKLSRWQTWTLLPRVRKSIRKIKQYYVWREQVRSDLMRVSARMRAWSLVLADRFVERGWIANREDYFLIRLEEVAAVIRGQEAPEDLKKIVAARREETVRYRSIPMPLLMRESELPGLIRTAGVSLRSLDESQLAGHPVSGGCVEAEVVVVKDPSDFSSMKPGAILVAPATDPSWTPLFTLASGVIVEVGGVLSHASTVAREYGLPALANVKHATRRLRTGERIRLDAINGVIVRLNELAKAS